MGYLVQKKSRGLFLGGLFLLCLFLATLNTIGRYYYFAYIAFFIFLIMSKRVFRINFSVVSLLALGFSWMIFSPNSTSSVLGVVKPYTYLVCYLMGYGLFDDCFSEENKEDIYPRFYKFVAIVSAGPLVHYLLNWIKNGDTVERNTVDIWTGEIMAATGQASLACIPLALAVACLFINTGVIFKFFSWITIGLILGYNLVLSGRTILILFAIVCAFAFLYRLKEVKKGRFKTFVKVLLIILLIILLYNSNAFGVKNFVESSLLYERFYGDNAMDIAEDGRLYKKSIHIANFLEHPFGGAYTRGLVGYSHDLYLDTYDEAGVFAFVAVIAYMVSSLFRLAKCIRDKRLPFAFRQIVFCIYLLLNIEFWVEPILQGMPWLFATYCLFDGALSGFLSQSADSITYTNS